MSTRILSALAGLGLAVVAALPVPAGATFKPETRAFEVTVTGIQTDAYSYSHHKVFVCDVDGHGSGTEVVRFASAKPELIDANRLGPNLIVFGNGHPADDEVLLHAKITRHRSEWHGAADPTCNGSGGGATSQPPDCGTKHAAFDLMIGWLPSRRRAGLTLGTGFFPPLPAYHNCPINGIAYPSILTSGKRSQIVAALPPGELFSPSKISRRVTGAGRYVLRDSSSWQETTIKWTVKLTPVHEVPVKH